MRTELVVENVEKSVLEIRSKVKNMQAKYRTEKKKIGPSGGSPSTWQFYGQMHKIVGSFACNDESLITESINNYDSQTQELWGSTSVEYDDNIIYEDTISNPPSTSSPVPQSSCSGHQSSSSAQLPCSSRRAAKRKLSVVQEDLLEELKRANERSEAQMDTANTIAANANKIMEQILELMKSNGK